MRCAWLEQIGWHNQKCKGILSVQRAESFDNIDSDAGAKHTAGTNRKHTNITHSAANGQSLYKHGTSKWGVARPSIPKKSNMHSFQMQRSLCNVQCASAYTPSVWCEIYSVCKSTNRIESNRTKGHTYRIHPYMHAHISSCSRAVRVNSN